MNTHEDFGNTPRIKKPEEMGVKELVETALEVYARSGRYINKILHDRAMELKAELINRLTVTNQAEPLVMPMLTDIEVKSGWEAWLNNSFKAYKKDFSDKLRKSNKRSGVIETPKKWIENYYKELLEITERYLNASKHSA